MTDEITDDEAVKAVEYLISRLTAACGLKANALHIGRYWLRRQTVIRIDNQFGLGALKSMHTLLWLDPKVPKEYLDEIIMTDELGVFIDEEVPFAAINPFYGKSYDEIKVMTDFGSI